MRVLFGVCSLLFSSCYITFADQERVYIVDSLEIPQDDEDFEAGRDIDGDGVVDNNLPEFANTFTIVDLDLQAQLTNRISSGDFLFGVDIVQQSQRRGALSVFAAQTPNAPPRFDGTDLIVAAGDEDPFTEVKFANRVRVLGEGAQLLWPMFPFQTGDVLSLPLHEAQLDAFFDEDRMEGKLTGFILASEVGPLMEQVPAVFAALLAQDALDFGQGTAIPCEGDNACGSIEPGGFCSDKIIDNNASGVCVDGGSSSALIYLMDGDGDGVLEVDFNEETGRFDANELDLLFDFEADGNARGVFGSQFTLDIDDDGIDESMPVGVRFTAVPAARLD